VLHGMSIYRPIVRRIIVVCIPDVIMEVYYPDFSRSSPHLSFGVLITPKYSNMSLSLDTLQRLWFVLQ
jgi:hypothetical protein